MWERDHDRGCAGDSWVEMKVLEATVRRKKCGKATETESSCGPRVN